MCSCTLNSILYSGGDRGPVRGRPEKGGPLWKAILCSGQPVERYFPRTGPFLGICGDLGPVGGGGAEKNCTDD